MLGRRRQHSSPCFCYSWFIFVTMYRLPTYSSGAFVHRNHCLDRFKPSRISAAFLGTLPLPSSALDTTTMTRQTGPCRRRIGSSMFMLRPTQTPFATATTPTAITNQYRRLSTSAVDCSDFALWSAVASPVLDESDDVLDGYILQVKAIVTKNEGTAIGFYCFQPGAPHDKHLGGSAYFDLNRNAFEAYYSAIVSSLDYIHQHHQGIDRVTVQCDHDTVVHQLNGKFEIQRESLRSLYWKVMEIKEERFEQLKFVYIHGRQNKEASDFANKALGSKSLMNYHFDMNDPMRSIMGGQVYAAGAVRTQKSTKGSRLSKNSKDANPAPEREVEEEDETNDTEAPAAIKDKMAEEMEDQAHVATQLSDVIVPKQRIKTASKVKRAAAMDSLEAKKEESAAPSPSIATRNGPRIHPDHVYILEFDGGSRGNPAGAAGAGCVLYDTGPSGSSKKEVWAGWQYLGYGNATNNQAEYSGLIVGLSAALARGVRKITILGDSILVVKHLTGEYKVRNERLKPLWSKTKELLQQFESYDIQHIYRHHNGRADGLANLAMDNRESGSSDVI